MFSYAMQFDSEGHMHTIQCRCCIDGMHGKSTGYSPKDDLNSKLMNFENIVALNLIEFG